MCFSLGGGRAPLSDSSAGKAIRLSLSSQLNHGCDYVWVGTLISQELSKLLAEILECDAAALSGSTNFHEHANWDSIAYLSTVVAIEERFGLVPPLGQLKTISDLASYIEGNV